MKNKKLRWKSKNTVDRLCDEVRFYEESGKKQYVLDDLSLDELSTLSGHNSHESVRNFSDSF